MYIRNRKKIMTIEIHNDWVIVFQVCVVLFGLSKFGFTPGGGGAAPSMAAMSSRDIAQAAYSEHTRWTNIKHNLSPDPVLSLEFGNGLFYGSNCLDSLPFDMQWKSEPF
jgi:hypothetical protein